MYKGQYIRICLRELSQHTQLYLVYNSVNIIRLFAIEVPGTFVLKYYVDAEITMETSMRNIQGYMYGTYKGRW
jgi:hypothetical protein